MTPAITVADDLSLTVGPHLVARLKAHEALDLAAELARRAFRHIAHEESAEFVFDKHDDAQRRTATAS